MRAGSADASQAWPGVFGSGADLVQPPTVVNPFVQKSFLAENRAFETASTRVAPAIARHLDFRSAKITTQVGELAGPNFPATPIASPRPFD